MDFWVVWKIVLKIAGIFVVFTHAFRITYIGMKYQDRFSCALQLSEGLFLFISLHFPRVAT